MKYGLCPRAIAVLKHQLALYRYLKARGRIEHDQLFFNEGGQPIRHLGYLAKCWRKSSDRLGWMERRSPTSR
jgi:hypothetical protein